MSINATEWDDWCGLSYWDEINEDLLRSMAERKQRRVRSHFARVWGFRFVERK